MTNAVSFAVVQSASRWGGDGTLEHVERRRVVDRRAFLHAGQHVVIVPVPETFPGDPLPLLISPIAQLGFPDRRRLERFGMVRRAGRSPDLLAGIGVDVPHR